MSRNYIIKIMRKVIETNKGYSWREKNVLDSVFERKALLTYTFISLQRSIYEWKEGIKNYIFYLIAIAEMKER